ncbi:MAG: efflux RND transporter periplasmic adaptor subunit [Gammaproteobacteria bacterium]|nr:efflux RND transporter periplasmic adaptor subunit [Gammaproteobacteria bacterium]
MNKQILYPIVVMVLGLGLAVLIAVNEPEMVPEPYEPLVTTVRVTRVEAAAEYLGITSQGTVQPRSQSELIPEVSGRVVWISHALVGGGAFQQDAVLLRIDDADYRTLVDRGEASLKRAEAEYGHAADELERMASLHKRQLASQQQLDNARRAAQVADANLIETRAGLEQANRDLARTELRAPFDGLVRNEQVDVGQFITRGQSIGTIYATDYVEVRLPISADQLGYLGLPVSTRGQIPETSRPPVTVSSDFGNTRLLWEGQLMRLEAEIDERSRMIYGVTRLRLEENEDSPILPVGMFVQAEIRGRRVENIIRLPRSAMRDNNQVLVVDADNRLHFRQVSLLRLEHDDMLINDGLADGELVCISPLQTVVEGMRVNPVKE